MSHRSKIPVSRHAEFCVLSFYLSLENNHPELGEYIFATEKYSVDFLTTASYMGGPAVNVQGWQSNIFVPLRMKIFSLRLKTESFNRFEKTTCFQKTPYFPSQLLALVAIKPYRYSKISPGLAIATPRYTAGAPMAWYMSRHYLGRKMSKRSLGWRWCSMCDDRRISDHPLATKTVRMVTSWRLAYELTIISNKGFFDKFLVLR